MVSETILVDLQLFLFLTRIIPVYYVVDVLNTLVQKVLIVLPVDNPDDIDWE